MDVDRFWIFLGNENVVWLVWFLAVPVAVLYLYLKDLTMLAWRTWIAR